MQKVLYSACEMLPEKEKNLYMNYNLFDVPRYSRTDNDVSGLAPIYIPAAG